jgi:hypothetical protein
LPTPVTVGAPNSFHPTTPLLVIQLLIGNIDNDEHDNIVPQM